MNTEGSLYDQIQKGEIITSLDQLKPRKDQAEINKRNLHILETKLFGKLKAEEGETALSLLGRE